MSVVEGYDGAMLPKRDSLPTQHGPQRPLVRPAGVVAHLRYKAHGLLESIKYAIAGIYFMLRTQRNMRIHTVVGFAAFGLAIWLHLAPLELSALAIVASLVVICEMFNTAVENAVDLATHRRHPLAKAAKDVAAAAVLAAATNAVLVGCLLMGPRLVARFLEVFRT